MAVTLLFLCVAGLSMTANAQDATTVPAYQITDELKVLKAMVAMLSDQVANIQNTLNNSMSNRLMCPTQADGSKQQVNQKDCYDVQKSGSRTSGVYTVYPPGEGSGVQVYCNMDVDGGGWLVIQKRDNGHVDFYRTYSEYEAGFGNKSDEHWLGNRYIHEITNSGDYELLVILEDFQKHVKTAHYSHFQVGSATESYKLDVSGYNGTAGDSLIFDHNGKPFSTHDADHDSASTNCAQVHHGGYWYSNCLKSNINGQWGKADATGITWGSYENWRMYVLKHTEMLIRPVHRS